MSRTEKEYQKALQTKLEAEKEARKIAMLERLCNMESKQMLPHDDVIVAKNIIFELDNKLRKTIALDSYEEYLEEIEHAYNLFQEGLINMSLYHKIIQYRLIDIKAIKKYYKKGGLEIDREYCTLINAIHILANFYKLGVINKLQFEDFTNECFNAERCFLLDNLAEYDEKRNLYSIFMHKIENGYKVIDTTIRKRCIIIHMEDSSHKQIIVKKNKILGKIYYSK